MRAQFVIPVLVSILILGSFGLSQQVFAAHTGCLTNTDCNDGNACTVDICRTLFGICTHAPGNAGDVCRTSTDACDAPETCDGVRGFCPVDAKSPADTACGNPGDGICDLQDTCDGAGNCVDEVAQVTVSCREADNDCDAEELCDGAGSCPADVFEPAGNVCGIPTFGVDQNCDGAGICVPSSAITCGEGTTFNEDTSECEANICEPGSPVDKCEKCQDKHDDKVAKEGDKLQKCLDNPEKDPVACQDKHDDKVAKEGDKLQKCQAKQCS